LFGRVSCGTPVSSLVDKAPGRDGAADERDRRAAVTLLNAGAVRERAGDVLAAGLDGRLDHFTVHADWLAAAAVIVADVVRTNYPNLAVPFHARWRHFVVAGRDPWRERAAATRWPDAAAQARAAFDLATVSVLLDAGADRRWRYRDPATGAELGRAEGPISCAPTLPGSPLSMRRRWRTAFRRTRPTPCPASTAAPPCWRGSAARSPAIPACSRGAMLRVPAACSIF
jgi:hypothetical protein